MRKINSWYGIIIEKDFICLQLFPFRIDILLFSGVQIYLGFLDFYVSLQVGYSKWTSWDY
tara:strand:- start:309 stop:488 length:180 start_codon:yes stop_codon:yes gene_type:complete